MEKEKKKEKIMDTTGNYWHAVHCDHGPESPEKADEGDDAGDHAKELELAAWTFPDEFGDRAIGDPRRHDFRKGSWAPSQSVA